MTNLSDTLAALKPCPFCGSGAHPRYDYFSGVSNKHHFVECDNDPNHRGGVGCYDGAPGKNKPNDVIGSCDKCTRDQVPCILAARAWNTRTGQLVPVPSVERVVRLRQAAVLLLNHAEGCAVNHYGEDFAVHGMPGWLADCRADIEAATAVIAAMQEGRDG